MGLSHRAVRTSSVDKDDVGGCCRWKRYSISRWESAEVEEGIWARRLGSWLLGIPILTMI